MKKSGDVAKFSDIFVDAKDEKSEDKYEPISKAQLKKIRKFVEDEARKDNQKKTKEASSFNYMGKFSFRRIRSIRQIQNYVNVSILT